MNATQKTITAVALFLIGGNVALPVESQTPPLNELQALSRLPKTHYSATIDKSLHAVTAILSEYVRITGACTVHAVWTSDSWVDNCIAACRAHGAEFAVYYEPLQRRFNDAKREAKEAGEAFNAMPVTLEVNGRFDDELRRFSSNLMRLKAKADEANVHFGAVILEHAPMVPDDVTGAVLEWKLNRFAAIVRAVAPQATLIWFGRGGVCEAPKPSGWEICPWVSLNVDADRVSLPLYWVEETYHWRQAVRMTANLNEEAGVRITPFVSIGWQWVRDRPNGRRASEEFRTANSFRLGAELNQSWFGRFPDRFLPNHLIPDVVFWPPPGWAPEFWPHFIAYVSGATYVQ